MRSSLIAILCFCVFSCKKEDKFSEQLVTKEKLVGTWSLISETRKGMNGFPERYIPPIQSRIEFSANGKAYPALEGQFGFVYNYHLDAEQKTIIYGFVFDYLPYKPFIQESNITHLSDKLLVIEQNFKLTDIISGAPFNLYLIDSLTR